MSCNVHLRCIPCLCLVCCLCMRCMLLYVCCCISHSFALGGKYGISLMVYGTMCRRLFGPLLMIQALPNEMMVMKMMKPFVLCGVTNTPPQFVGSAMRGIALSVLTLTLVGMKLCMLHRNFALFLYIRDVPMLQYTRYFFLGRQSSARITVVE